MKCTPNTMPSTACDCHNANCSRCNRHRIDTSSIGRHMKLVDGALVCHDCARKMPQQTPEPVRPYAPGKADYLRSADQLSRHGFHVAAALLRVAARTASEEAITFLYIADLPAEFQDYPVDDAAVERFASYCSENGIFYYARPRELYSTREAVTLAAQAGCTKVLLEDMS